MGDDSVTKLTVLERNGDILDNFYEDLVSSLEDQNKVQLHILDSPSLYLPSLGKVSGLLGSTLNQKRVIDSLESYHSKPLSVSKGSRYALFKKGVSERTARKLLDWLKGIPLDWKELFNKRLMVKINRSAKVNSNASEWFPVINAFHMGIRQAGGNEEGAELTQLFNFIERRCNTEVELLLGIKKDIEDGKLSRDDTSAIFNILESFWRANSRLSSCSLESLANASRLFQQKEKLTKQQTMEVFKDYAYLYFDFYLDAITHYDIGFRMVNCTDTQLRNDLGILTRSIFAYTQENDIETCFAALLEEFKTNITKEVGDIGYRKLASFIEIKESAPSEFGESKADKQYKQLKDWRKGRNLPSNEKLSTFLENLSEYFLTNLEIPDEYIQIGTGPSTFEMSRMVIGVDKLRGELLKACEKDKLPRDDVEIVIKKVLSNIPDYYRVNLKRELENREPKI